MLPFVFVFILLLLFSQLAYKGMKKNLYLSYLKEKK